MIDKDSVLPPPPRPHFDDSRMDERVVNSVHYLTGYEHATSRALFTNLLPFAALLADMCLDRAYVDLLCCDYRNHPKKPPVVRWIAHQALTAYMKWDELPFEEQFDEAENMKSVPWDDFIEPVAANFSAS